MWEWIRTAETAELIFYGLLAGLVLAEVVFRFLIRLPKNSLVMEYVDSGFVAIILALVIRTFLLQAFKIPSGSMESTLLIGDHLLVNKLVYGLQVPFIDRRVLKIRDPRRGDIVVFKYPENPRRDFIKRCVGVPGDIVEVRNKTLFVNGEEQNEGYTSFRDMKTFPPQVGPRDFYGPVTVPADSFFMMGDNRDFSADSRFWGFLPRKLIKGKAWVIYWPPTRWRIIK